MNLEKEIQAIKQRNAKVESDKAWETSWMRRILIAILTYIVIVLFFFAADLPNPFVNSLVPTIGFLLSTLTLSFARNAYARRKNK